MLPLAAPAVGHFDDVAIHPFDYRFFLSHTQFVPAILRSKLALWALLGAFLIPVTVSTLRGLTHVLTCRDEVATPFTFLVGDGGQATLLSSTFLEESGSGELCGGLSVDLRATTDPDGQVALRVPITNDTAHPWQGTVLLRVEGTDVPVDIGEIGPGATAEDTIDFRLDPGQHEVSGSLLIGP
jgi:hypothetical protein